MACSERSRLQKSLYSAHSFLGDLAHPPRQKPPARLVGEGALGRPTECRSNEATFRTSHASPRSARFRGLDRDSRMRATEASPAWSKREIASQSSSADRRLPHGRISSCSVHLSVRRCRYHTPLVAAFISMAASGHGRAGGGPWRCAIAPSGDGASDFLADALFRVSVWRQWGRMPIRHSNLLNCPKRDQALKPMHGMSIQLRYRTPGRQQKEFDEPSRRSCCVVSERAQSLADFIKAYGACSGVNFDDLCY